jgi:hypothetical protein
VVVAAVVTVAVPEVFVAEVVIVVVIVADIDACTAGLEYFSVVLGHPLNQFVSVAVVMTLTVLKINRQVLFRLLLCFRMSRSKKLKFPWS